MRLLRKSVKRLNVDRKKIFLSCLLFLIFQQNIHAVITILSHNVTDGKAHQRPNKLLLNESRIESFKEICAVRPYDIMCFQELPTEWLFVLPGFDRDPVVRRYKGVDQVEGEGTYSLVRSGAVYVMYDHEKYRLVESEGGVVEGFSGYTDRYKRYVSVLLQELETKEYVVVVSCDLFKRSGRGMKSQIIFIRDIADRLAETVGSLRCTKIVCGGLYVNPLRVGRNQGKENYTLLKESFFDNGWSEIRGNTHDVLKATARDLRRESRPACFDYIFYQLPNDVVSSVISPDVFPRDFQCLAPCQTNTKQKIVRGRKFFSSHARLSAKLEWECFCGELDDEAKSPVGVDPDSETSLLGEYASWDEVFVPNLAESCDGSLFLGDDKLFAEVIFDGTS